MQNLAATHLRSTIHRNAATEVLFGNIVTRNQEKKLNFTPKKFSFFLQTVDVMMLSVFEVHNYHALTGQHNYLVGYNALRFFSAIPEETRKTNMKTSVAVQARLFYDYHLN